MSMRTQRHSIRVRGRASFTEGLSWLPPQGDRVCDVCKAPIANLPEVPPRAPTEASDGHSAFDDLDERGGGHPGGLHGAFVAEQMPSSADIIFDCIRVRRRGGSALGWNEMSACACSLAMCLGPTGRERARAWHGPLRKQGMAG